jgi:soluble lytic murein transglycosylase-like protein
MKRIKNLKPAFFLIMVIIGASLGFFSFKYIKKAEKEGGFLSVTNISGQKQMIRPWVSSSLDMALANKADVIASTLSAAQPVLSADKQSSAPKPLLSPSPLLTPMPTLKPAVMPSPSPTPQPQSEYSSEEIQGFVNQYCSQYNVDPHVLRHIAVCESGFNPKAVNLNYAGLLQFSSSAWANYRLRLGRDANPHLRLDAKEAVWTGAYVLSVNEAYIWPNCLP